MTLRKPMVWVNGRRSEMPAGDTVDPACLPASSGSSDASFPFFMG